jgi:hypothetical protein
MAGANRARMSVGRAAAGFAVLCTALQGGVTSASPASPAGDVVMGTWQHHQVTFTYVGFTAFYTCSGLEDHVRQILVHLGARKDAKVSATGCRGPIDSPSGSAWVDADFYSLTAADNPVQDGAVQARWTPLRVSPRRPEFVGAGDCELIQGMKDLITKNFSLRNIEYNTSCFPHQVSLAGFEVKGEALRAVPMENATRG